MRSVRPRLSRVRVICGVTELGETARAGVDAHGAQQRAHVDGGDDVVADEPRPDGVELLAEERRDRPALHVHEHEGLGARCGEGVQENAAHARQLGGVRGALALVVLDRGRDHRRIGRRSSHRRAVAIRSGMADRADRTASCGSSPGRRPSGPQVRLGSRWVRLKYL